MLKSGSEEQMLPESGVLVMVSMLFLGSCSESRPAVSGLCKKKAKSKKQIRDENHRWDYTTTSAHSLKWDSVLFIASDKGNRGGRDC